MSGINTDTMIYAIILGIAILAGGIELITKWNKL
jgi:hypothetical protein